MSELSEVEEVPIPQGRPWLLAVGAGLLVAAGIAYWYARRCQECGEDGAVSLPGTVPVREAIDRLRGVTERQAKAEEGPPVGTWDDAAIRAWGVTPAGPQTIGDIAPTVDISALDFEEPVWSDGE